VKARWDAISYGVQKDHIDYMAGIGFQFSFGPVARAAPAVVTAPVAAAPVAAPPPPPPVVVPPPPPPVDTDGDGVPDARDQCPTTPRGEPVDAMGCGFQVRLSVQFENNSAKLKPDSLPELDTAASLLNRVTSITAVIEGHTDSVGDAAYNQKLSQQRAQSVTDYLVSKGVSSSRLQAKGFGESQPIADNATADGRAQNRRVLMRRTDATK
jgi:OOP family OmpA-OmpF porin